MRFSFVLISTFLISLSIVSCQKEISPLDGSLPTTTDSTGAGNDTSSAAGAYQPLGVGSWWKYKDSASGAISTTTVAPVTRTFNNILYQALVSSGNSAVDTGWMAAPSPNYYLMGKGVDPMSGASFDLTFFYLNDTAPVGKSWSYNAGSGNGFAASITTTVIAKDVSVTVNGKTYNRVTQTRLDLSYDVAGTVSQYGTYYYFIAKGIGIIKIRTEVSLSGVSLLTTSSDLVDYGVH